MVPYTKAYEHHLMAEKHHLYNMLVHSGGNPSSSLINRWNELPLSIKAAGPAGRTYHMLEKILNYRFAVAEDLTIIDRPLTHLEHNHNEFYGTGPVPA